MTIRPERPDDASRVRYVNELAFGQPGEADLVERLRQAGTDSLSLVAEDDAVVGHILFTSVVVVHDAEKLVEFLRQVFGATGNYRPDLPSVIKIGD